MLFRSYKEEIEVVKSTTSSKKVELKHIVSGAQIIDFQQLVRKIPIADNVLEYAVSLATKTRPGTDRATPMVNSYISWGALFLAFDLYDISRALSRRSA